VVALALGLGLPPSAGASFHLNTVSEVFPSATPSQQFVELRDPAAEPFPAPDDYWLALYDGAGNFQAKQQLPSAEYRNSTAPYLVAASAPFDRQLAFTLPTSAGQLCFFKGDPAVPGAFRVNCLGYGNISMPLGDTGPLPPAGESLQRLTCGQVGVAAPTRDATNAACPFGTGGGGAGGGGGGAGGGGAGGGGAGGGGGIDDQSPTVKLKASKRQDVDRLAVFVRSGEDGRVTVQASVAVPAGAARTLRFKTVRKSLRAGVRKKLRLRMKRSRKRAVKRALARGRRLRAKIKITVKDGAGNRTVKRVRVRLKD
jgi:hypothetical protein